MKKISLVTLLTVLLVANAQAADYKIDPDHSTVAFKVKHLTISTVPGRFTDFTGTFSFDPENMTASKAEATIKVKSIATEAAKRDAHLQSPDFFDVEKFPAMTFKTSKVVQISKNNFTAEGDLTLHGVTKPVSLNVEYGGSAKDAWGNERAAFSATTKISRKDFGLTWNKTLETGGLVVSDEVQIALDIEGVQQK